MRCLLPLLLLASLACAGLTGPPYPLTTPPEAVVDLDLPTLMALTREDVDLWERHMRSSLAWEVRRDDGCLHGVRLEPRVQRDGTAIYESSLNGFYSDFQSASGVYQTRVITGLGCQHGFGVDRGQITWAVAGATGVYLTLEDYMDQPGLNSELLVRSDSGLTVEIYEQGDPLERPFTRAALTEVEAELAAVLAHRQELEAFGVIDSLVPEGSTTTGTPTLAVDDGMQPGIYLLTGWVNPGHDGEVQARVFFDGPAPGHTPPAEVGTPGTELSAARLRPCSTRLVGWGPDPQRLFRYQSEVTVYEGEWGQPFMARFELWSSAPAGVETKLAETTRQIEGWSR